MGLARNACGRETRFKTVKSMQCVVQYNPYVVTTYVNEVKDKVEYFYKAISQDFERVWKKFYQK